VVGVVGVSAAATSTAATAKTLVSAGPEARHVLLLSVDGLHQSDLAWYIQQHPASALAKLVHRGVEYTHAQTPFPSDSFPGMVGQITGGDPKTTGIYYDDNWDPGLLPAGTSKSPAAPPGAAGATCREAAPHPA